MGKLGEEALRDSTEDELEFVFEQMATGEDFVLRLLRGDQGWQVEVPPMASLRNTLERLKDARAERGTVPLEDMKRSSPRDTLQWPPEGSVRKPGW